MTHSLGLDWYSIHKLQTNDFSLQRFNEIVSSSQIGYGLDNVSHQFRKKLLILFQNASKMIKNQLPELVVQNNQLSIKKKLMADNIARKQYELQTSFQEISNMRIIYAEKKRMLNKLKQKIAKKQKKQQKKIYYCAFCERQDFVNVQALKTHISSTHPDRNIENRSETSNQVKEIKDLLMTMKDKQIEMMSMFLRASREMQTQKLQNDYEAQYKRVMHISGTKTDESKEQNDIEQLKGQSKFLFFPKSQPFRRQTEKQVQFRNNLKKQKEEAQQKSQKEIYKKRDYYNIFPNITENVSAQFEQNRITHKRTEQSNQGKSFTYYDPNQFLSKFLKNQSISKESRLSMVQNTPKPYIQLNKQQKLVQRQQTFVSPSISDRLRQINKRKQSKDPRYDTMFSTKRKFYEDSGYVFNSGPLIDDKGGDSDYEDYFGSNVSRNSQIQDEQIKMHPINSNKSYFPASKQSFHLSKLLSPKESNSQISKFQKEKSSVIVDLSDSFSRRDFEISKDEDTINLSQLKLSKLQKKKEEQRLKKLKEMDEKKSFVSDSNGENRSNSKQAPSSSDYSKVSKQNTIKPETRVPTNNILKDFQRKKVMPLVQQDYIFEDNLINNFLRKNERINIIESTQQLKERFYQSGNIGILGQFMKKSQQSSPKRSVGQPQQLKDFLKK